jgi:hypothetical protein
MKRILTAIFFLAISLDLWAYKAYEPVVIPDRSDPFDRAKKIQPLDPMAFYVSGGLGYLFSSASDLAKIQDDFTNAGLQGLSPVGGYYSFRLEMGIQNLFRHFDIFGIVGYSFSTSREGTGDINYGLETLNTTMSFGQYSIPLLVGAKYSFYNTNWIRLGAKADLGISIIRGHMVLNLNEASSSNIQDSSMNFGGTGIGGEIFAFAETMFTRSLTLEFNLGYSIMRLNNVKITSSSGNFATEFEPGKRLMIYDPATGTSSAFSSSMKGFVGFIALKALF